MKRLFRRTDLLVVAVLLAAALAAFLFVKLKTGGSEARTAVVRVNGETVAEIDLGAVKEPYRLPLENGVVLLVEPGAIRFSSSPCPGQDCVHAGRLSRPGQVAACIPTGTLVLISGAPAEGDVDAVAG